MKINEIQNTIDKLSDKEKLIELTEYYKQYFEDDPQLSINICKSALKIAEKNSLEEEKAKIFINLANVYQVMEDYHESLKFFNQALLLTKNNTNLNQVASIEYEIAKINHLIGNLDIAKRVMKKVCNKYETIGNKKAFYSTLFMYGNILYHASDFEEALEIYQRCLKYTEQTDEKKIRADCLNDMGLVYISLSSFQEALSCFLESLRIRNEIGDTESNFIPLSNIGNIYFYLDELENALDYYKQSIELLDKKKNEKDFSKITNNMGSLYFELEKYEEAEIYFKKSLEIKREMKAVKSIALTLSNLGEISAFREDWVKALEYYTESIDLRTKMNDKKGMAHTYIKIAKANIGINKFQEVLPIIDKAEKIARAINVKSLLDLCYELKAEFFTRIGDYKDALLCYKEHINIRDEILSHETKQTIVQMQSKYEIEKKEREAEIYRLKNIELVKANEDINSKNKELNSHKEHLKLINKILRHDLINNLSAIKSSIKVFHLDHDEKYINSAYSGIKKSTNLIRRMHDLENILSSNKNLNIIDIRPIIEKVASSYDDMDITVSGNSKVLTDQTINSVMENIIGNSKRHSKSKKINISILEKNNFTQIKISDFGIGIPDHYKEKIFEESFVSGDSAHTGLGLYIVKKAVENCNGYVFAEDNIPNGTSIIIMLKRIK